MADRTLHCDIAVIGGGIAGASVAAELAAEAEVVLLEAEAQPGYHTTGRSAAVFAPFYGPAPIRALTRASGAFFDAPPDGFAERPLLTPVTTMFPARADQMDVLRGMQDALSSESPLHRVDAAEARHLQPLLREGYAEAALVDESGSTIDVAALHQGYLRHFRAAGGTTMTGAEVQGLTRNREGWAIDTPAGRVLAKVVVNAAGAWADRVGALAGAGRIGLLPKRRSALIVSAPPEMEIARLPLTVDVEEEFYLKPDAGKLLISPANEDPDVPSDVQPDEMDIAICIDRIERAFDLRIHRIDSKWAGLRSFVADKAPVAGWSRHAEGFFWLAGQGGYGIQSAPALARYAAAAVLGREMPADIADQGLRAADIGPARLETAPDRSHREARA